MADSEFTPPERPAGLYQDETPVQIVCQSDVYAFITSLSEKHSPAEVAEALVQLEGNGGLRPTPSPISEELIAGLQELAKKYGDDKVFAAAKGYVGVARSPSNTESNQ